MPLSTKTCVACHRTAECCNCDYPTIPDTALKFAWAKGQNNSSSSLLNQPRPSIGMKRQRSNSGEIEMDTDDEAPTIKRRIVKFVRKSLSISSLFGGATLSDEQKEESKPRPTIPDTSFLFRH